MAVSAKTQETSFRGTSTFMISWNILDCICPCVFHLTDQVPSTIWKRWFWDRHVSTNGILTYWNFKHRSKLWSQKGPWPVTFFSVLDVHIFWKNNSCFRYNNNCFIFHIVYVSYYPSSVPFPVFLAKRCRTLFILPHNYGYLFSTPGQLLLVSAYHKGIKNLKYEKIYKRNCKILQNENLCHNIHNMV